MQKTIYDILRNHKNSTVGFKVGFNTDVIETVTAFSNSMGGRIFVGVSDKSKIVGIENLSDETIKKWINAIHKDYRNQTDVIVKIYDNSIVFTNPGKLLGGIKPEDLYTNYYLARHRNKLLCEAFYLLREIEKFGTGFLRIRRVLENYPELSLNIEQVNDFFKVTIKSQIQNKDNNVTENVTENRLEQIIFMKTNPRVTINQLAKIMNVTRRTIIRDIDRLKKQKKIKRVGSDKKGHWEVLS